MNDNARHTKVQHIMDRIDRDIPAVDPDVERAIEAVRNSTPGHVIDQLEAEGLFDNMLTLMKHRFGGRPLETIATTELTEIARDSVDETLGFAPLTRTPVQEFPSPWVTEQTPESMAVAVMEQLSETISAWQTGKIDALTAATKAEEILFPSRKT